MGDPRLVYICRYRNEQVIEPTTRYWMHYDGHIAELTIHAPNRTDSGTIRCVAKNYFGSRDTSCSFHVSDPDRPQPHVPRAKLVYDYR